MNFPRTLLAIALAVYVAQLHAQNNCTTLIQYGLRDEVQSLAQSNSYQQSINQMCRDYQTFQSDKKSGNVKASYGAFDGSAGFSAERYESLSDALCTNNTNIASLSSANQLTNKLLNPAALEALKQCEELNRYGVRVTTELAPNDERIAISFLLAVVPGTTGQILVESPQHEQDVNCSGPSPAIKDKLLPPNQSVTYICSRKIESAPFEYLGKRLYAKPTMVTIPTSSGPVSRNLPAIYAERLPPTDIEKQLRALKAKDTPIGALIASHLSFDELKKDNPDFATYWQPADGRSVARDTAYFKIKTDQSLNAVNLPDLRGVFLRGMNRFDPAGELGPVSTVQADPETRKAGSFQGEEFKSHNHPISNSGPAFAYQVSGMGIQSNKGTEIRFTPPSMTVGAAGGAETRPKNVAVYYYIRVN